MSRILIVDDEPAIREMVAFSLASRGYRVQEAGDAEEARTLIQTDPPDLVLLDWMLPGLSGLDLARELRRDPQAKGIPIIMLTARGEESNMVRGLEAGADDYVRKPFSPRELRARIQAVLRRVPSPNASRALDVHGLRLDPDSQRVTVSGQNLSLGPMEYRLLHFFMRHSERVYSRTQLLDYVWGSDIYIEERTVDVLIRRLRKVLSDTGHDRLIQTVRGSGYRFSAVE